MDATIWSTFQVNLLVVLEQKAYDIGCRELMGERLFEVKTFYLQKVIAIEC